MMILTIESSCDETAVAVGEIRNGKIRLLSHVVSSQIKLHAKWGGVVPTLAAREHAKNLLPVLKTALKEAGIGDPKKAREKINLIGVTQGPGLIPSLLLGVNFAKGLSYLWNKPLIPVNHMEGHIYSSWVKAIPKSLSIGENPFPLLALLVSGGHTMLVKVSRHLHYEILGGTLDDAVGEAFDKVARILGLSYPGGPEISKLAKEGNPDFQFALPLRNSKELNFSFSGLKTAVLYKALEMSVSKNTKRAIIKKHIFNRPPTPDLKLKLSPKNKKDLARAFEDIAVESLIEQTKKALAKNKYRTAIVGGGVAANELLRKRWSQELSIEFPFLKTLLPPVELTGDNAVMLLPVVYLKWQKAIKEKKTEKYCKTWKNLEAEASLKL